MIMLEWVLYIINIACMYVARVCVCMVVPRMIPATTVLTVNNRLGCLAINLVLLRRLP